MRGSRCCAVPHTAESRAAGQIDLATSPDIASASGTAIGQERHPSAPCRAAGCRGHYGLNHWRSARPCAASGPSKGGRTVATAKLAFCAAQQARRTVHRCLPHFSRDVIACQFATELMPPVSPPSTDRSIAGSLCRIVRLSSRCTSATTTSDGR